MTTHALGCLGSRPSFLETYIMVAIIKKSHRRAPAASPSFAKVVKTAICGFLAAAGGASAAPSFSASTALGGALPPAGSGGALLGPVHVGASRKLKIAPPPPAAPLPANLTADLFDYVSTNGTGFVLQGKPFYFAGTNDFSAAQLDIATDDEARANIQTHAQRGAQVIRFFAFSNGYSVNTTTEPTPEPIQPTLNQYSELPLRRMDLVLAEGAKNNLRFIMPLANFEPRYGGMQWYVDQVFGPGLDRELFLTDPTVKQAYKNYTQMLVNRRNTVNGIAYKDDPTILAWELCNEPHTTDLYEQHRNQTSGTMVNSWLSEMSMFIRQQGIKQLVSSGEEGYRTDGNTTGPNTRLNNGYKGVDFTSNIALASIDFATVHVYPDNWGIDAKDASWIVPNYIADRATVAHAANKPIIMEEYGMQLGYMPQRDDLFAILLMGSHNAYFAGTLVWQTKTTPLNDSAYDFNYTQSGAPTVLHEYALMLNNSQQTQS